MGQYGIIEFVGIDLTAVLALILTTLPCSLVGNYLVLKKQSMMSDAISHAVLPGIVLGFLIAGDIIGISIFIGAAVSALLSVLLILTVTRISNIDIGAVMGCVFVTMFALGVLMMEQIGGRNIHIDPNCVLYGQLESVFWIIPKGASVLEERFWLFFPMEILQGMCVSILVIFMLWLFKKEFTLICFDEAFARSVGVSPAAFLALLYAMLAISCVSAFVVIGSILVIAAVVCPSAIARIISDRLRHQIILSAFINLFVSVGGYAVAVLLPMAFGKDFALNAAGTVVSLYGFVFFLVAIYGNLRNKVRRIDLGVRAT